MKGIRSFSKGRPLLSLIAVALISLPPLALLYYIRVFSVNVLFMDEWDTIPIIQKMSAGTLSISDLFAQHNEHRILFPRAVILILAGLTRYNTVAEMFLSWVLLSLSGLLIFLVVRRKFSERNNLRAILNFLPVALLLFSFRQYAGVLWGFSVAWYMMIFGLVATFYLLDTTKKMGARFLLSLLGALLASFSGITGLLVWPVGTLQIALSEDKKPLYRALLWALAGGITFVSYFYGWVKPSSHPSWTYFIVHPLESLEYLLVLIGAPFFFDDIPMAMAYGFAIAILAILVLTHAFKAKLLKENRFWLSLVLFGALSSLATMVGRSGFGVLEALSEAPSYTPMTALGIIGLYLLATSVSRRLPAKSFGAHALLVLILVGSIIPYGGGWKAGQELNSSMRMSAYVLTTYKIQSDENIRNFLYPDPERVRQRAPFLEQSKLNVFSEQTIDLSALIKTDSNTDFSLDAVNGIIVVSRLTTPVTINSGTQQTITISGWAVDKQANDLAYAVFVTVDGRINIPCLYGLDRQDVANAFENPKFQFSGFVATFSSSILSKGTHTISLKIVGKDRIHFYHPSQILYVVVS